MILYKGRVKPLKEENKVNPKTHPLPPLDRGERTRLPAPPASPHAQGKPGRRFGFFIGFYLALSLLLLVVTGTGRGQGSGWHYLSGNLLRVVKFVSQEGWVVGSLGHIMHTSDGGENWELQVSGTSQDLLSLSFINPQTGWIGGMYGTFLKTTNGGNSWIPQTAPSGRNIKALFIDDRHGWITVSIDSIYRTTNGGMAWEVYASGVGVGGFDRVAFIDSLMGWSSGTRVLKTTNGGITWTTITMLTSSANNICMLDSLFGWAAYWPTHVFHTSDGWNTWVDQRINVGGVLYDISFQDTVRGYLCGGDNNVPATLYWTTNGGSTWLWDSTLVRGDNALYAMDGSFQPNYAIAVGAAGAIVKTTNGGTAWGVVRNTDIGNTSLYNGNFANANRGWAVGTYGVITHTVNGGTIWRRQVSGVSSFLYGVSFADSQYGKICTGGGGVLGTRNGGTTWAGESTGAASPLWSIAFPDTAFAAAVGGHYGPVTFDTTGNADSLEGRVKAKPWSHPRKEEGKGQKAPYRSIIRTTNGGALWLARNTGENPLYGVAFITRNNGWACGDGGVILHTTDLGATWQTQTSGVTNGLYWITFQDTLHGWACGSGGRVLWTTDGGNAWNIGNSGVTQYLNSIAFTDTLTGFAVSDNGLIIRSTDGGRNWVPDTSKVYANLTAVCALDSTHVWTVGSFGMVLGWGEAGNTGIEERVPGAQGPRGQETALGQSYPNPTRGIASFEYELGKAGKVRVKVYNLAGQLVRTLVDSGEPVEGPDKQHRDLRFASTGRHVVTWDGKDSSGKNVRSGTYFYRLEVSGEGTTRKLIVIR